MCVSQLPQSIPQPRLEHTFYMFSAGEWQQKKKWVKPAFDSHMKIDFHQPPTRAMATATATAAAASAVPRQMSKGLLSCDEVKEDQGGVYVILLYENESERVTDEMRRG